MRTYVHEHVYLSWFCSAYNVPPTGAALISNARIPRTGGRDLKHSAAYPPAFGVAVANLHAASMVSCQICFWFCFWDVLRVTLKVSGCPKRPFSRHPEHGLGHSSPKPARPGPSPYL